MANRSDYTGDYPEGRTTHRPQWMAGSYRIPNPEPIIAALDLGSNSFHLVIVRARPDRSFQILHSEKHMLRLGEEVARTGFISKESLLGASKVIAGFKELAATFEVDEFVAVGTAALREAENSLAATEFLREQSGIKVSVISGHREAELIYHAIRSSMNLGSHPVLAADLGGGSLELMVGDQRQLYTGVSIPIGVGKLKTRFSASDPATKAQVSEITNYIDGWARAPLLRAMEFVPQRLIVSSGTLTALVRAASSSLKKAPPQTSGQPVTVSVGELTSFWNEMIKSGPDTRAKLPTVEAKRNDLLPYGWFVLSYILSLVEVTEVSTSPWALREGIVLDKLESVRDFEFSFGPDELRSGSVRFLVEKYLSDTSHVEKVRDLALYLFDTLEELHKLSMQDRELLGFAAYMHDIGESISLDDHDRHSAYLLEAVRLKGFTGEEIGLMSSLLRFHRKGTPKPADHEAFAALSPRWRDKVLTLLAILRVADGLDRSHQGAVREIVIEIRSTRVLLVLRGENDLSLEINGLRKKKELFEQIFNKSIEVVTSMDSDTDGDSLYSGA